MATGRPIVDIRSGVVAESSAIILPIIFVVAFYMTIADFFVAEKDLIQNIDQYLYMALSSLGLIEYVFFRKLRMLKIIAIVYLGGTQVYRFIAQGEISSISFAWIPPVILLASFIYSVRLALGFILLYASIPVLLLLGITGEKLPNIFNVGSFTPDKIFLSLIGAIFTSLAFTYVFEVYRRRIQVALKESSHVQTEEKFFATLGHEVNNPITIAILALNRNYSQGEDSKRDRILENLSQLALRSKEFDTSREKFRL